MEDSEFNPLLHEFFFAGFREIAYGCSHRESRFARAGKLHEPASLGSYRLPTHRNF